MRGWLVVNAFTRTQKFLDLYEWLERAARVRGIDLVRVTTIEVSSAVGSGSIAKERLDFVLFWDKDVWLCRALELAGIRCFNRARAIELCDDKALTYLELLPTGIAQPRTMLVPKVFHAQDWRCTDFPERATNVLGLPLVVKERFGSFGAQVHLATTCAEVGELLNACEGRPVLCQEFVASSAGHDVRLQVVGKQVVAAMERVSTSDDFRANVTNGAQAHAWEPTAAYVDMALRATASLGLDFAGVDLLFGAHGEPILCEVNSNAHFINLYDATGVDVANALMNHVLGVLAKE